MLAVETIRGVTGTGKVEAEIRYFLTSCGDDPAVLVQAIRRHWSVENALHWVLDVTFREDDSRVRDRTAARNLALLRKIALNLVARDRGSRASLRGRRKNGRLERRLHAPDHRRPSSCVNPGAIPARWHGRSAAASMAFISGFPQ